MNARRIKFDRIATAALMNSESILRRWLPDGCRRGSEWVARNPRRADRRLGSFKINLRTGRWGDFATNDHGGDLISLAAYLFCNGDQGAAAIQIAAMLRMDPYGK